MRRNHSEIPEPNIHVFKNDQEAEIFCKLSGLPVKKRIGVIFEMFSLKVDKSNNQKSITEFPLEHLHQLLIGCLDEIVRTGVDNWDDLESLKQILSSIAALGSEYKNTPCQPRAKKSYLTWCEAVFEKIIKENIKGKLEKLALLVFKFTPTDFSGNLLWYLQGKPAEDQLSFFNKIRKHENLFQMMAGWCGGGGHIFSEHYDWASKAVEEKENSAYEKIAYVRDRAEIAIKLNVVVRQLEKLSAREREFCNQCIQSIRDNLSTSDLNLAEISISQLEHKILEFNTWHVLNKNRPASWLPAVNKDLDLLRNELRKKKDRHRHAKQELFSLGLQPDFFKIARRTQKSPALLTFQQEISELLSCSIRPDQNKAQLEKSWLDLNPYSAAPNRPEFLYLLLHLDIKTLVEVLECISNKGTFLQEYYSQLRPPKGLNLRVEDLMGEILGYLEEEKEYELTDRILNIVDATLPGHEARKLRYNIYIRSISTLKASQEKRSYAILSGRLDFLIKNKELAPCNYAFIYYERALVRAKQGDISGFLDDAQGCHSFYREELLKWIIVTNKDLKDSPENAKFLGAFSKLLEQYKSQEIIECIQTHFKEDSLVILYSVLFLKQGPWPSIRKALDSSSIFELYYVKTVKNSVLDERYTVGQRLKYWQCLLIDKNEDYGYITLYQIYKKASQLGLSIRIQQLKIIESLILKIYSSDKKFVDNSLEHIKQILKEQDDLLPFIKNIIEAKEVKLEDKIQLVNGLCDIREPEIIGKPLLDPACWLRDKLASEASSLLQSSKKEDTDKAFVLYLTIGDIKAEWASMIGECGCLSVAERDKDNPGTQQSILQLCEKLYQRKFERLGVEYVPIIDLEHPRQWHLELKQHREQHYVPILTSLVLNGDLDLAQKFENYELKDFLAEVDVPTIFIELFSKRVIKEDDEQIFGELRKNKARQFLDQAILSYHRGDSKFALPIFEIADHLHSTAESNGYLLLGKKQVDKKTLEAVRRQEDPNPYFEWIVPIRMALKAGNYAQAYEQLHENQKKLEGYQSNEVSRYKKSIPYEYLKEAMNRLEAAVESRTLKQILKGDDDSKIEECVQVFAKMSERKVINLSRLRSHIKQNYQPEAIAARLKTCEAKLQGLPKSVKSLLQDIAWNLLEQAMPIIDAAKIPFRSKKPPESEELEGFIKEYMQEIQKGIPTDSPLILVLPILEEKFKALLSGTTPTVEEIYADMDLLPETAHEQICDLNIDRVLDPECRKSWLPVEWRTRYIDLLTEALKNQADPLITKTYAYLVEGATERVRFDFAKFKEPIIRDFLGQINPPYEYLLKICPYGNLYSEILLGRGKHYEQSGDKIKAVQDYESANSIKKDGSTERKIKSLKYEIFKDWGNPDLDPEHTEQVSAYIAGLGPGEYFRLMNDIVLVAPLQDKEIFRSLLWSRVHAQCARPIQDALLQRVQDSIKARQQYLGEEFLGSYEDCDIDLKSFDRGFKEAIKLGYSLEPQTITAILGKIIVQSLSLSPDMPDFGRVLGILTFTRKTASCFGYITNYIANSPRRDDILLALTDPNTAMASVFGSGFKDRFIGDKTAIFQKYFNTGVNEFKEKISRKPGKNSRWQ